MKKSLLAIFGILLALIIGLILISLFYKPNETAKKKIVTSIFPIYDIAKNIVEDRLEVSYILPPGSSPHTFEPKPADAVKVSGAQMIFIIGHGLDIWAENLASANAPQAQVITLDKNINLRQSSEGGVDPHYFVSLSNADIIMQTILNSVALLDPLDADFFYANAQKYDKQLRSLYSQGQAKLSSLSDRRLITFHEAFSYFASDFGLSVVTTIEPFPGKEPTAQYLAEVSNIIDTYKIKSLFKEPQLSSTVLEGLARDKGVQILTLDPEGSVGRTFLGMMGYDIQTVYDGLK